MGDAYLEWTAFFQRNAGSVVFNQMHKLALGVLYVASEVFGESRLSRCYIYVSIFTCVNDNFAVFLPTFFNE